MTKEELEKIKETFPKFTVYVCYRGDRTTAKTGDWYAEKGKDYSACTEALKKEPEDFKERQDEDLFNIVREKELNEKQTKDVSEFIERLRNISFEVDELLDDMEENND